jgi:hypothetical protein
MDKQQLRERLEELHNELQQIHSVDEGERQILQKVIGDINKLIEAGDSDQPHVYDRLGEGLREGIERLEASHPRATMLMGQVVDALAKIGI